MEDNIFFIIFAYIFVIISFVGLFAMIISAIFELDLIDFDNDED